MYDTIKEETPPAGGVVSKLDFPPSEDLLLQRTNLTRRASDTISTGSSTDGGGDLMKEILKEMKTTVDTKDPQEESIYSTLIRKDKKKRHHKKKSASLDQD